MSVSKYNGEGYLDPTAYCRRREHALSVAP